MRLLVLFFLAFAAFSSLVAFAPDDGKAVPKTGHACVAILGAGSHAFVGTCQVSEH